MRVISTSALPIQFDGEIRSIDSDLTNVEGIICLLRDRIDRAVLDRAPQLKIVANVAVGVDNIDLAACRERGVLVSNTPDVLTEATAEFAFLLALAVARRLGEGERLVRSGAWTGWALDQLLGVSLIGSADRATGLIGGKKTLGIVGLGRIGRAHARMASGFGMNVLYTGGSHPSYERVELEDLFTRADVVSLHCPLTPDTRHVVNAARLARMKPTAILVNTARGGCVDEDALFAALERGQIHGAGLDVFAGEPEIDKRFYSCPRLVLAPHIGSATTETRTQMAQLAVSAVETVLAGGRPANLVTK